VYDDDDDDDDDVLLMLIVRMQTPSSSSQTIMSTFTHIVRYEGGYASLYTGVRPTVYRAGVLTASQLSTYDHTKHTLLHHQVFSSSSSLSLHVLSSIIAGFVASTMTAPIDLIKSRYMIQTFDERGNGDVYKNVRECVMKTFQNEGARGL
jgi:hypothetical protein